MPALGVLRPTLRVSCVCVCLCTYVSECVCTAAVCGVVCGVLFCCVCFFCLEKEEENGEMI